MYKLMKSGVLKDGRIFIPNNPRLGLWQEYEAWFSEGNSPLPADPTPEKTQKEKHREDPEMPSVQEVIEALFEKEEGDPQPMNALLARYSRVKTRNNK